MNQRQLKPFYRLLAARRQELLDEAVRTVGGMTDPKENFPDPTDRASLESDRNFMLRIRDREHKLIKKIKKALERNKGKRKAAATELGISERTLYRKIKQYDL